MEIALFLVLGFVAYMYDSVERTRTALHRTFSALLAATLVHLVFDALTLYTMNHLDSVPKWLNDGLHRLFEMCIRDSPPVSGADLRNFR